MKSEGVHGGAQGRKKAYQKPRLVQIALRPDEAVLGACKSGSASGPGNRGKCTSLSPCSSQGS